MVVLDYVRFKRKRQYMYVDTIYLFSPDDDKSIIQIDENVALDKK